MICWSSSGWCSGVPILGIEKPGLGSMWSILLPLLLPPHYTRFRSFISVFIPNRMPFIRFATGDGVFVCLSQFCQRPNVKTKNYILSYVCMRVIVCISRIRCHWVEVMLLFFFSPNQNFANEKFNISSEHYKFTVPRRRRIQYCVVIYRTNFPILPNGPRCVKNGWRVRAERSQFVYDYFKWIFFSVVKLVVSLIWQFVTANKHVNIRSKFPLDQTVQMSILKIHKFVEAAAVGCRTVAFCFRNRKIIGTRSDAKKDAGETFHTGANLCRDFRNADPTVSRWFHWIYLYYGNWSSWLHGSLLKTPQKGTILSRLKLFSAEMSATSRRSHWKRRIATICVIHSKFDTLSKCHRIYRWTLQFDSIRFKFFLRPSVRRWRKKTENICTCND